MKVALVTNWNEKCGNAEYAANLVKYVDKVDIKVVARPLEFEHIFTETRDVDLIHFNCVFPEFRSIATQAWPWPRFKEGGKRLTIMVQDSSQEKVERTAALAYEGKQVFDVVAVHEKTKGQPYPSQVRVIPHGLLLVDVADVKPQQKVGTAGFPMPWKGFVETAFAAQRLGLGYLAIMPESHHIDVQQTKRKVLELCPQAEVITDWLTHEQIIRRLAECFATVYAYGLDYLGRKMEGISGAVRFGLAAKRPIIISRCSLFRDLQEYEDEVYSMDKGLENAIATVAYDWNNGKAKMPKKILEEMNWKRCADRYTEMWADAMR